MAETLKLWPSGQFPQSILEPYLLPTSPGGPWPGLVLVLPGGGYENLMDYEGVDVARWLNTQGFHAAVLKYRIKENARHPGPMLDAQRAMRLIRRHGGAWGIGTGPIGVLGFSAGGHLAGMLATKFDQYGCEEDDLASLYSSRPNAAVLCYAALDAVNHPTKGGLKKLVGEGPSEALLEEVSPAIHGWAHQPPMFLWHTANDDVVPAENSLAMAMTCRKLKRPVELLMYEEGKYHGLAMGDADPRVAGWKDAAVAFLRRHLTGR
ncbi:MAG: alpha/beta hydrolase [Phycisphaeraceae bacterium]|nr:alpha/beta hydrolase [Phycisphaeraceae bacterium]